MPLPKQVNIVEVGPRDGLQNETAFVPTEIKIDLINRLSQTGLKAIEVTSFVSPKWIPQLRDHQTVFSHIDQHRDIRYLALVPNQQGFNAALTAGVKEIALFTAASDTFTMKNIHCTIAQSIQQFKPIIIAAKNAQLRVRAYISCALGCPYEGDIAPQKVVAVASDLYALGCDQISIGDTIGIGTPKKTEQLLHSLTQTVPMPYLAGHFHDTYGQALVNIYVAMSMGMTTFDSAIAGLGGCPYAKGASGNVATEDLVYMLNGMGITTGIDLDRLIAVSIFICEQLNKRPQSKVTLARIAKNIS